MKQGNIYYTDKDFTDLEVSTTFKYPCMLILKNAENEIVKITTYDELGNKSVSKFDFDTLDTVTERGNTTANEITVGGLTTNYVQLDTTSANSYNIGKVYWNSDKGTYNFGLLNNVELQLGQEQHVYGKAYSAITNGQLVMYRTSQGGHILFEPADFTQLSTNPDLIIGVATQDIALNDFGYITPFGEVNTLNTSSFSDGNTLYFGSGNVLQNTVPSGSYFIVGRVNRSHATQGSIFVKPYFVDSNLESKLNKQNNLTPDDGTKYPTVNAVVGGLISKLDKGTYTGTASDLKSLIDTKISGSGTSNYIPKFSPTGTIGNSVVYDNGTNVGISNTDPRAKLSVGSNNGGSKIMPTNTKVWIQGSGGASSTDLQSRISFGFNENPDYGFYFGNINVDYGATPMIGVLGTRDASVDKPALYVKDSKVGVGTMNPTEKLEVNGKIKDSQGILKSQRTITVTGNITLSETHNGAVLNVTNTCNITIPTGLDANFQCVVFAKGSVIVTFVNGGVTVYAPSGLLLKTDKMASLVSTSANNFNLTGELATS